MEKKIALFAVTIIIVFVSNPVVLALSPMGPPKALLGQDRWDIGIEYANTTMDLEADSTIEESIPSIVFETAVEGWHNIDNFKSNIVMARAGYGINNNWDAFVRLGLADAKCDIEQNLPLDPLPTDYEGYDGSFGLAYGFGTRATFWQDDEVCWGGLLQITWLEPGDSSITLSNDPVFTGDAEIDIWEVQIAVGPTFRVDEGFRVYCGPFLHFVNGDLDISGRTVETFEIFTEATGDIEEKSQLGGYAGAHMDVDENTSCSIELQYTSDAWGVAIGAARRF